MDRFIVDVGDVHRLVDMKSKEFERAAKKILEYIGPKIPDMGKIIDRRPAGVHPDFPIGRRNGFFLPSFCIE